MNTRMYHLQLILSITFLFLSFSLSPAASCHKEDEKALIAFKNSFPNNTFPNWEIGSECCFWDGIECGDSTGRVTSLLLTSNPYDPEYPERSPVNLVGTIPPSIGNLTALKSIGFQSFRELVGTLPPEMANLKNLQYFGIFNCSISGPIPSFISEWTSLIQLSFDRCSKLKGPIPPSLGNLVNLTVISFYNNKKLTGTIPESLFSRLSKGLQPQLLLSHNKLTGPIPQSFASIDSLYIDVSYNQLCGPIPTFKSSISTDAGYFEHNKCLCGPPLAACK